MSNKKNLYLKGSLTIEMTLIMPIIIGVMLFVIFSLYYFHDTVAINKGVSTALIRGSLATNDAVAAREMRTAMSSIRLLGRWELDLQEEVLDGKVEAGMEGEMTAAEGLFRRLIRGGYLYGKEGKSERIDEVKYIRSRRRQIESHN